MSTAQPLSRPCLPVQPTHPVITASAGIDASGKPSAARPHQRLSRVGVLGHLDALYALAYLGSGDPDAAEEAVIGAFDGVCTGSFAATRCRLRLWRLLADHVHLMRRTAGAVAAAPPAPFREGTLTDIEREAIALLLVGRREREAARLLGVSLHSFRRHARVGLETVHATRHRIEPSTTRLTSSPRDVEAQESMDRTA